MYEKELKRIDDVIAKGPYKDEWASLQNYETPSWFKKAKFGIFIHWGVFTVPEWGSEWYPRFMYMQSEDYYKHHVETYGPHKEFGYKDFIPMFKAEKFDPDAWVELFKKSGAKYMVPVAEHHDGFQLYKSEFSKWNSADMGPHRDIIGELKDACERNDMNMGTSSHRMEHWFFFDHGREFDSDIADNSGREDLYWPTVKLENDNYFDPKSEPFPSQEFLEDWLVRTCELIDRVKPKVLYFDWWIQHVAARPYVKKMIAYYYDRASEWNMEVVLCYKYDAFAFGAGLLDVERGQMEVAPPFYWQTDTSTALNSWCYTTGNKFRTPESLVQTLVDVVAKNGNLLLNVGPKADGSICKEEQNILDHIGKWLEINGAAIYDSYVWRCNGEGPTKINNGGFSEVDDYGFTSQDIRYTVKGDRLYALVMKESEDGRYCLSEMAADNKDPKFEDKFRGVADNIRLLGSDGKVEFNFTREGLMIRAPKLNTTYPVVFEICLK
ncbi:MAG: alpha-L-fucosidase [Lachnospiraceae bacterium]|nr:alpha-L-fucosidase [Lachnospiraceae bacterium]